jgi:hypothetical protein
MQDVRRGVYDMERRADNSKLGYPLGNRFSSQVDARRADRHEELPKNEFG